jgi:uridine kinase
MAEDKEEVSTSLEEILKRLSTGPRKSPFTRAISIDGPAGSGKTTLASRISENYEGGQALTIHMDELYNGWEDALTSQLTRTLVNQILTPATQGKPLGFRKYDWLSKSFGDLISHPAPKLLILEGVGSGQKATRAFADELIWIDIDSEVGLQRVLRRDGDYLETEMRIWQIREQEHFKSENTRDCATIRVDGNFFI